MMGRIRQTSRTGSSLRVLLAVVCVLLVVIAGTVQVAHTHTDGAVTHADCSLCVAAHIAVHLVQTPTPAPSVAVVTALEAEPSSILPAALSTFALFTRPPPEAASVPA
jgi:hypothetical protein